MHYKSCYCYCQPNLTCTCYWNKSLHIFLSMLIVKCNDVNCLRSTNFEGFCIYSIFLLYTNDKLNLYFLLYRQCWLGHCLWKILQSLLPQHYWSRYLMLYFTISILATHFLDFYYVLFSNFICYVVVFRWFWHH
jgi:hypothetical protein